MGVSLIGPRKFQHFGWNSHVSSGISVQSTNFGHFGKMATKRCVEVQGRVGLSSARLGYAGMGCTRLCHAGLGCAA